METEFLALIIAIVGTGIAIIGVVLSMMFWVRGEANSLRTDAKEDRKDLLQVSRNIEMEMRDFHTQLIQIQKGKN
jgi:hypothetical protein